MNIPNVDEILQTLQNLPENKNCFECGVKSNTWASVNNGIFLCLRCSGLHRNLGANISFIRSINLDSWSEQQVNYLRNSGNRALKSFFEKYNIDEKSPMEFKYKTKAAQYYRDKLKAIVENFDFVQEPPSLEEGLEIIIDTKPKVTSNSTNLYEPIRKEEKSSPSAIDKFKHQIINAYDKTTDSTKHAFSNLNNKIKEIHISDDLKKFGSKISEKSKEFGDITSKKAKEGMEGLKEIFSKKKNENNKLNEGESINFEQVEQPNKKDEDSQRTKDLDENQESNKNFEEKKNQEIINDNNKKQNSFEKVFTSFWTSTKNTVNKVGEKINDPAFKEKVLNLKDKVSHGAKELGEKTSDFAKKSYDDMKKGIEKLKEKKVEKEEVKQDK